MSKVCVVGGGPAGMFAAIYAAQSGADVLLMEKNEKMGKKLFITGKGRCNVTNACDTVELFDQIVTNEKFLYSAIYGYDNFRVMDFFESRGCKLKTERGNRVFPQSDHSSDIIKTLERELKSSGVEVRLKTCADKLLIEDGKVRGLTLKNGAQIMADRIILATGGLSYPQTGSTGDGLTMARETGHRIAECMPSLVALETEEEDIPDMMGLSLKNVALTVSFKGRELYREQGEMLFTHFGVSGPLVLSASARCGAYLKKGPLDLEIDLKPALSEEQLDARILRDFGENANRDFQNVLGGLLPTKMIPVVINRSHIDPHKKVHDITRLERQDLLNILKHFTCRAIGTRDFKEAIITKGGVNVKDLNPSTMESKLVENLYMAGELIDCDAVTGGFNLQIAWSTGYLAGISAAEKE